VPISTAVRRENGENLVLGEYSFRKETVMWQSEQYHMLSMVDPYANTIFNSWQIPWVQIEVARLSAAYLGSEEFAPLDELAQLCKVALKSPHRYLWFIGD